jgi:protein ImuA
MEPRPDALDASAAPDDETLDTLLGRTDIWRGRTPLPGGGDLPTGHPALDACLGGGWPRGALVELLTDQAGIGEVSLLLPLLAAQTAAGRHVALVAPPHIPYAPALAGAGIALERVLVIGAQNDPEILWSLEQALGSGACGAALAWPGRADTRALRRLQLAAERGQATGFLYRQARQARQSSPAAVRLRLAPADEGLAVQILKRRRGWGGSVVVVPQSEQRWSPRINSNEKSKAEPQRAPRIPQRTRRKSF